MPPSRISSMKVVWSFFILLEFVRCFADASCSCFSGVCTCSGPNITDLSGLLADGICDSNGTFSKLKLVDVPNLINLPRGFSTLHESPCAGLRALEYLEMHQTGIRNVSSTLFQGLNHLRTLDLSDNQQFKTYREGAFEQLGPTLTDLIATDNRVHSLMRGVFTGLKRLKRLTLSRNKIGYVEDGAFTSECCEEIVELSVDGNILTDLEDQTFVGLTNLKKLDLRGNPLQRLSARLFDPFANSLIQLHMSHNDTAEFGGFDFIPHGLFLGMSQLEELSMIELKMNNLTTESFNGLTGLRKLSLRGNRLTVVPKGYFTALPELVELDISDNGLVCFPDNSAEYYPRLRSLDLSRNGLTHLTKRSFAMLASSKPTAAFPRLLVNISSNPIQRIELDTFCGFNGPVDIIVAPSGVPPPSWATMEGWPDSPFALVGDDSFIHGLLDSKPIRGRTDAATLCGPEGNLFRSKFLTSSTYSQSKYTEKEISNSLNSECPWLIPGKLSPWQLSKLGVSGLHRQPGSSGDEGYALEEGSRIYLLIIVAVCITFLLAALTIIMCYRAWSRRTTKKVIEDGDASIAHVRCEASAMNGEVSEKHELQERPRNGLPPTLKEVSGASTSAVVVNCGREEVDNHSLEIQASSLNGRRNSEPRGEQLETMTAFGVL